MVRNNEAVPTRPPTSANTTTIGVGNHGHHREAWTRRGIALLSGLLTTASVPPFGWWPLAIVGLGLLPLAIERSDRTRHVTNVGALFSIGLYIPSLWWLTQFSLPGGIVIALIEVVITTLTIVGIVRPSGGHRSTATLLQCAAAIVAADTLRSLVPFGGLPLGGIDLGQADGPFAALVTFGGRLLLIGIVALLGGALVHLGQSYKSAAAAVTVVACLVVTVLANVAPDGTHPNRTLRIAIAQGSGPLGVKAVDDTVDRAYKAHLAATKLIDKPVDLILWPENIVDAVTFATDEKRGEIGALATEFGAPIVAGVVEDDINPTRFRNFSIVVGPGGDIGDGVSTRYDKVRRVPFGEVVYFRSLLERFSSDFQAKDARPGTKPGVVTTPFGPLAIIVSYEGFFDDRARSGVRAGGQALLLPTNASSFTSSHLPTQQLAAARLRARETGRWVAQAAPTGISAILTPRGRIVRRSAIQERTALQATITLRQGLTPYARWNDGPALALFAVIGGFGHVLQRRKHRGARRT